MLDGTIVDISGTPYLIFWRTTGANIGHFCVYRDSDGAQQVCDSGAAPTWWEDVSGSPGNPIWFVLSTPSDDCTGLTMSECVDTGSVSNVLTVSTSSIGLTRVSQYTYTATTTATTTPPSYNNILSADGVIIGGLMLVVILLLAWKR